MLLACYAKQIFLWWRILSTSKCIGNCVPSKSVCAHKSLFLIFTSGCCSLAAEHFSELCHSFLWHLPLWLSLKEIASVKSKHLLCIILKGLYNSRVLAAKPQYNWVSVWLLLYLHLCHIWTGDNTLFALICKVKSDLKEVKWVLSTPPSQSVRCSRAPCGQYQLDRKRERHSHFHLGWVPAGKEHLLRGVC